MRCFVVRRRGCLCVVAVIADRPLWPHHVRRERESWERFGHLVTETGQAQPVTGCAHEG